MRLRQHRGWPDRRQTHAIQLLTLRHSNRNLLDWNQESAKPSRLQIRIGKETRELSWLVGFAVDTVWRGQGRYSLRPAAAIILDGPGTTRSAFAQARFGLPSLRSALNGQRLSRDHEFHPVGALCDALVHPSMVIPKGSG